MGFARFIHLWLWGALRRSVGLGDFIAGIVGNIVTVILHFYPAYEAAMKDLLWQIPIYGLAGAMAWRLMIVPYELWKEAMATPASNVADDVEREYQIERAKQRAILEADVERSRRSNSVANKLFNPTLADAAEKIVKDRQAEEEAARVRMIADAARPPRRDRFAELREDRRHKQVETDKHRRAIISACRDIVQNYRDADLPKAFGEFVDRERAFLDIQPHLGADYFKGVLNRKELEGVQDTRPYRDYEAAMFLRELARLEKEWKL